MIKNQNNVSKNLLLSLFLIASTHVLCIENPVSELTEKIRETIIEQKRAYYDFINKIVDFTKATSLLNRSKGETIVAYQEHYTKYPYQRPRNVDITFKCPLHRNT